MTQQGVHRYLADVDRLTRLSRRKRRRLITELSDHITDIAANTNAESADAAFASAVERLGPPLDIAQAAEGRALGASSRRQSPWDLPQAGHLEVPMSCGGHRHSIVVVEDDLELTNHDVESELVLAGLGGAVSECVEVLRAWRHPRPADVEMVPAWLDPAERPTVPAGLMRDASTSRHARMLFPAFDASFFGPVRRRREMVSGLPWELRRVLCTRVLAAAERDATRDRDIAAQLRQVVCSLARRTLASVDAPDPIRIAVHDEGSARLDGRVLSLPLDWVRSVYARGMAVLDGRLVVGVVTEAGRVSAVDQLQWRLVRRWEPVIYRWRLQP